MGAAFLVLYSFGLVARKLLKLVTRKLIWTEKVGEMGKKSRTRLILAVKSPEREFVKKHSTIGNIPQDQTIQTDFFDAQVNRRNGRPQSKISGKRMKANSSVNRTAQK